MELTTEIVIDMRDKYINTIVDAVQYDKNSRIVKATLLFGGTRFSIPTGATYRVNFKRADGASGAYTELSDGSAAVNRSEANVLEIGIHELVTNISGKALISVTILDVDSEVSTFSFILNVQKAVTESSDLNKKYPDTYDATAGADDLATGKTAYINGEKVVGAVPVVASYTGEMDVIPQVSYIGGANYICLNSSKFGENGKLFREGSHFYLGALPSEFGDAQAADVAKGKVFTSAAGLKVVGTNEGGGTITAEGVGDAIVITTSASVSASGDAVIIGG
jgi:hypothetical protein